jgi:hypothetical protein
VDIQTAINNIESGDLAQMKTSVDLLKNEGKPEHIELLKNAKTKLPIYESVLLESIDLAVESITLRSLKEAQPACDPGAKNPETGETGETNPPCRYQGAPSKPDTSAAVESAPEIGAENNGGANGNGINGKNNDFPQNEYLDKVKDIWEKGKSAAIKNATFIKLKSQLNTIKNDKIIQLKHLGETVFKCYSETPSGVVFLDEGIANINEIDKKISRKQEDEKEIEESRAEGGFWNMVKSSISRFAGYTKIKLDISILQSNRESKLSALGQTVYDKLAECEAVIVKQQAVNDVLLTIKDLDRQREEKEIEISEISQSE